MKPIILQLKFFLVEFLNLTYSLFPNPLRMYYLRLYGIIGGVIVVYIEDADSFM